MRICHISDTHGKFKDLTGKFDAVVHSGDFFPNSYNICNGNKYKELEFQKFWLQENLPQIINFLKSRPFLYILGNHDFVSPSWMESQLRDAGIEAYDLTDKVVTYQSINFYGFPYIPYINGMWNYEKNIPEMQIEMEKMSYILNSNYIDILVCHSPINNILDLSLDNENLGSTVLAYMLNYKIDQTMIPAYYLHGHIHEASGISYKNNMIISNAATIQQIIEV